MTYSSKDGAVYNKDYSKLLFISKDIKEFEIPDTVNEIATMAIYGTYRTIHIPSSVTVFNRSCILNGQIYYEAMQAPNVPANAFSNAAYIHVHKGAKGFDEIPWSYFRVLFDISNADSFSIIENKMNICVNVPAEYSKIKYNYSTVNGLEETPDWVYYGNGVLTIDSEGRVTPLKAGTVKVTGNMGEFSDSVEISVYDHSTGKKRETIVTEPSCTTVGKKVVIEECEFCHELISSSEEEIPLLDHSWKKESQIDKLPTCTEPGRQSVHCSICNTINQSSVEIIPALGHDWGKLIIEQEATLTQDGYGHYVCSRCNEVKEETISKITHEHEWKVDPELSFPKNREGICHVDAECLVCNEIQEFEAEYTVYITEPTCSEPGKKVISAIFDLFGEITEETNLPALGHIEDQNGEVVQEFPCAQGVKNYRCTRCGEIVSSHPVYPETDHKWNNGEITGEPTCTGIGKKTFTCTVCGETKTEDIPATAIHTWSNWVITREATSTTRGLKEHTCDVCGGKEIVDIPATSSSGSSGGTTTIYVPTTPSHTSHTWYDWIILREATCTREGLSVRFCVGCGEKEEKITEKLAHTPVDVEAVAATCTNDGNTAGKKCAVCGVVIEGCVTIEALGHDYGEWSVQTAAKCEKAGIRTRVCSRDASHVEKEEIPATGHSWGEWEVITPATVNSKGVSARTCENDESHVEFKIIPKLTTGEENGTDGKGQSGTGEQTGDQKDTGNKTEQSDQTGQTGQGGQVTPVVTVPAGTYSVGAAQVSVQSGKATITAPANKNIKTFSIPDTVTVQGQKIPVTSIAPNAFKGMKNLTSVTIGVNVETVGKNAFNGCKKLKKITIKTTKLTSKSVGAKAFKGIYSKATVKVPKTKKKEYQKFLLKKGMKNTMKFK